MLRKIYIGKDLLRRILAGEKTSDVVAIDIAEGMFIMDKTEGCVELIQDE